MRNFMLAGLGTVIGAGVIISVILANQKVQSEDIQASKPSTPTQLSGIVEGSISFPSEAIPEDLKVCAETLDGHTIACTDKKIINNNYKNGVGFELEIIPGEYFVYAIAPSFGEQKAYYNEFVTCGLSVACSSHKNIVVSVDSGETVTGIDPQDWYNQATPTP